MTLNASGPISLGGSTAGQSINLELSQSATAQVSLNDTNVRSLAGVASGAIVMPTNFYGKSAVTIFLANEDVADATGGASDASAGYRLTSAGAIQVTSGGSFTTIGQWCTPGSASADYEVFATLTSGGCTGTFGSWLPLSSIQAWICDATPPNFQQAFFTLQIRKVGTATILATANISLTADATP
jgi:hypothetical protein